MIDGSVEDRAEASPAAPGRAFDGPYRLEGPIGTGSSGIVYRAAHEKLDKPVAIKVLHERLAEDSPAREQFLREAKALTALEHANIVTVSDFGIAGDAPYLVMDLLEGVTLEERLKRGAIDQSVAETLMQALLRALAYMHVRGVVHGNLKPANVFLQDEGDGDERLKLLDFGVPRLAANSNDGGIGATLLALPAANSPYMSPEQAAGDDTDARSDVYAAGVMMMHMLAGRAPLPSETSEQPISIMPVTASPLVELASPELDTFISRALAEDRRERFGNADQMLKALLELPAPWFSQIEITAEPDEEAAAVETGPIAHLESESTDEAAGVDEAESELDSPAAPLRRQIPRGVKLGLAGGVVLLGLAGGFFAWRAKHAEPKAPDPRHAGAEPEHASGHADEAEAPKSHEPTRPVAEEHGQPATPPTAAKDEHEAAHPAEAVAKPAAEPTPPTAAEEHGEGAAPSGAAKAAAPEHADPAGAAPGATAEAEHSAAEKTPHGATAEAEHTAAEKTPHGATAEAEHTAAEKTPHGAPPEAEHTAAEKTPHGAPPEAEHTAAEKTPHGAPPEAEHTVAGPRAEKTPHGATAEAEHTAAEKTPHGAPPEAEHATATPKTETPGPSAAADPPKPPLPPVEGTSSERHIQPNDDEIRDMLVLAHAEPKKRIPPKDPWSGSLPKELKALRDSIAAGARGSRRSISALRSYNHENPNDVLGHLLLAGMYFNRGWCVDALDEYDLAFQIDPSSRGAPEMLDNALTMLVRGQAISDAERFIDQTFKKEALPAIERTLHTPELDPRAAARLMKLKARVTGRAR